MYEIKPLIDNIYLHEKNSWEQTRFIAYVLAQVNSTKKLKIEDIMQFGWDNADTDEHIKNISTNEIERLRAKADKYKDII